MRLGLVNPASAAKEFQEARFRLAMLWRSRPSTWPMQPPAHTSSRVMTSQVSASSAGRIEIAHLKRKYGYVVTGHAECIEIFSVETVEAVC